MIYYISDLHFGHKKVIEYDKRPFSSVEEMDETMIRNWNEVVSDSDIVFHLGDFTFNMTDEQISNLVKRLNGDIIFIKGNHDNKKTFERLGLPIYDYLEISDSGRDVVLFHYPIKTWNKKHYGSYHIYGHVHNRKTNQLNDNNAFNAFCGYQDYRPYTLEQLKTKGIK